MKDSNKMTLKKIAEMAGVNASTVSRVLNHSPNYHVSPQMRNHILSLAGDHRYVLSSAGRSLANQCSYKLGLLLHALDDDLGSPFTSQMITAFIREAREHGYHSLLLPVSDGAFDQHIIESIRGGYADAYWIGADMIGSPTLKELQEANIPAATCYLDVKPEQELPEIDFFSVEVESAFHDMFKLVRERGFRKFAFFKRDALLCRRMARYDGYRIGAQYGVLLAKEFVYSGSSSELSVYREAMAAAENCWTELSEYELVMCANDLQALAVYDTILRHGLIPGKDISVIGFDNIEENPCYLRHGMTKTPVLASFDLPRVEIGRSIAQTLIRQLEHKDHPPERHTSSLRFICRDSLGFAHDISKS